MLSNNFRLTDECLPQSFFLSPQKTQTVLQENSVGLYFTCSALRDALQHKEGDIAALREFSEIERDVSCQEDARALEIVNLQNALKLMTESRDELLVKVQLLESALHKALEQPGLSSSFACSHCQQQTLIECSDMSTATMTTMSTDTVTTTTTTTTEFQQQEQQEQRRQQYDEETGHSHDVDVSIKCSSSPTAITMMSLFDVPLLSFAAARAELPHLLQATRSVLICDASTVTVL